MSKKGEHFARLPYLACQFLPLDLLLKWRLQYLLSLWPFRSHSSRPGYFWDVGVLPVKQLLKFQAWAKSSVHYKWRESNLNSIRAFWQFEQREQTFELLHLWSERRMYRGGCFSIANVPGFVSNAHNGLPCELDGGFQIQKVSGIARGLVDSLLYLFLSITAYHTELDRRWVQIEGENSSDVNLI